MGLSGKLTWINAFKLTALEIELSEWTWPKPIEEVLLQPNQGVASQIHVGQVGQDGLDVFHILIHCGQVDPVEGEVQLLKPDQGLEGAKKAVVNRVSHRQLVVGEVQVPRRHVHVKKQPAAKLSNLKSSSARLTPQ